MTKVALSNYTISYTGTVASGETVGVDVAHAFNQTTSGDFTNTLSSAISSATSGVSGVSFNGTKLSFSSSPSSTSSARYAGSASQSSAGASAWTSISNATGSGTGTFAQATTTSITSDLRLTNFGHSIPSNATINGITVSLVTTGSGNSGNGSGVRITKNGTAAIGTTPSATGTWSSGSVTVGSSTSMWGSTWSPAEINASTFGILIALTPLISGATFKLDTAQVTVSYTTPGSAPTSLTFSLGVAADAVAESNEQFSVQLSNATRTGAGNVSIATASAQTTIVNYNVPPDAVNDSATTSENVPAFINVLANDTDPEGTPLSLVSVTQPAHGTTEIRPDVSAAIWNHWITTGQSSYPNFNAFYTASYGNPATLSAAAASVRPRNMPVQRRRHLQAWKAGTTSPAPPAIPCRLSRRSRSTTSKSATSCGSRTSA